MTVINFPEQRISDSFMETCQPVFNKVLYNLETDLPNNSLTSCYNRHLRGEATERIVKITNALPFKRKSDNSLISVSGYGDILEIP